MKYEIVNGDDSNIECFDEKFFAYNTIIAPSERRDRRMDIIKIMKNNENIIAGCVANIDYWNAMHVELLWVDEEYRHEKHGSELLITVEEEAKKKGAYISYLETLDFQAKGFYEEHGYSVIGKLDNYPKGHCQYFMSKDL